MTHYSTTFQPIGQEQSYSKGMDYSESILSTTTTSSIFSKDMNEHDLRLKEVESYYLSNLLDDEYIESFSKLNIASESSNISGNNLSKTSFNRNNSFDNNAFLNSSGKNYYDSMQDINKGSVYSSIPFLNVQYQQEHSHVNGTSGSNVNSNIFTAYENSYSTQRKSSWSSASEQSYEKGSFSISSFSSSPVQSPSKHSIEAEVAIAQKKLEEAQKNLKILQDKEKKSKAQLQNTTETTNNKSTNSPQRKLELKKINKTLYKTELCESYVTTRKCKYNNKCQFAHGLHELKLKDVNGNYRTKHCSSWSKYGYCKYGNRCLFKHGHDDDIKVYLAAGTIINTAAPVTTTNTTSTNKIHQGQNTFANLKTIEKINDNW